MGRGSEKWPTRLLDLNRHVNLSDLLSLWGPRMNWFERLIVQRIALITAVACLIVIVLLAGSLFNRHVTLDLLSKATDGLLKALAIVVGTLWSLNRYFTTRTDYPQLRVEVIIDSLPSTVFGSEYLHGLLSYRLDIINTGKVLLNVTGYRVRISNVILSKDEVLYEPLHEWHETKAPSALIEPGSWGGVSRAITCPNDVRAIMLFLEVELAIGGPWTWHRILSVTPTPTTNHLQSPAPAAKAKDT
jgi:hypothetical protein